ncbi:MAG: FixH family protein [Planctomycetes bacterium]|nr:FixH family protein [Planctomycetota bacterium]
MNTERTKGVWRVPAVLAFIFLSCFASVGALIAKSSGDPSFGIEPDYYAKALSWDRSRAVLAASDALGWSSEVGAAEGNLRVTLRDRAGVPVVGASVEAEVFAWNRSADRRRLTLDEVSPGVYEAALDAAGRWAVRLRGEREADVYLHEATLIGRSP